MDTTDLPDIGTIQVSVKVDSLLGSTLNPGNSGENLIWDFSNLLPCCGTVETSTDTIKWLNPQTTPNGQNFISSNLSDAMNCYTYHSHVTHNDELVCNYFYYIKNTDGLFLNGIDEQGNVVIYQNYNFFPLILYGDSTEDNARITKINGDTLFSTFFSYKSIADSWGTITTPAGQFNAIRIFTTESVFDSIYINGSDFQTNVSNNNYYYRWYSKGIKSPVLEIYKGLWHLKKTNQQKTIYSIDNNTNINSQILQKNLFKIYPNPVFNTLNISIINQKFTDNYNLIIYNGLGNKVLIIENIYNEQLINIEHIVKGFYFINILKDNKVIFYDKLIKL